MPATVRWVDNMTMRWGSCTPADGTIRISSRLRAMPTWVLDYVLVHELAHLIAPGHDRRFWAWSTAIRARSGPVATSRGSLRPRIGSRGDDDVLTGDRM